MAGTDSKAISGDTQVTGKLNTTGDFSVATSKLTVASASGDVSSAGNIAVAAGKAFQVNGSQIGAPNVVPTGILFGVITGADASVTAQSIAMAGTGAAAAGVGDIVKSVIDLTDLTDVTADFEATISVAGHISQSTTNLATKKCLVIIWPKSV